MCGIGALFGGADTAIVDRMLRLQQHRGPDGRHVWHDEAADLALGHARLSIVDLAGSDQPLHSDHGVTLVFNGEIYNHAALRQRHHAYAWRTSGDGEAILAEHRAAVAAPLAPPEPVKGAADGWLRRTADALRPGNPATAHVEWLQHLDGMFALALWDARRQELVLARDALGIKPLLRTMTADGHLLIASEAKAFRAHPAYTPRLDEAALVARLAWEYPLDQTSLLAGVTQVAPGTVETWRLDAEGRATLTGVARWHHERVAPAAAWDPDRQAAGLLGTLTQAVEDRLMADVPLGVILSGGLDSAMIAAVSHEAAEAAGQPVPTCYTVAEDETNPDWQAAEAVTSALDLHHVKHTMEPDAFWTDLPDLAWHGEDLDVTVVFFQPLFAAMGADVRVGLCGQGADELHAGYPRYRDLPGHAALVRRRLQGVAHPIAAHLLGETRAGPVPNAPTGPGQPWQDHDLEPASTLDDLTSTLQFELTRGQLANFQLRLVDRHSMAHSLEVRVPFLGDVHREAANALPEAWKLGALEKPALRRAAALTDLPRSIVERPKLPAGTATSPGLLHELLDDLRPRTDELRQRYDRWGSLLSGQDELVLGLRLFEATHLEPAGADRPSGDLLSLLDDVQGPLEVAA